MPTPTAPASPAVAVPTIFGVPIKYLALMCLIVQTTSAVILTRLSKMLADPHAKPYHNASLVASAEITKLTASLALMLFVDSRNKQKEESKDLEAAALEAGENPPRDTMSWSRTVDIWTSMIYDENFANPLQTLKLAIPAGLYTLQNSLVYVALENLEATTFQVGYQMKVITTAVLSVLMLNRQLSQMKWVAIFLLTFGIIMTQMDSQSASRERKDQNFMLGIASVITCGFSSALAGVYFEKILKGTSPTVWTRNAQLAFFSTVLAVTAHVYMQGLWSYFEGYNKLAVAIIMVQAIGGLIVAVVVKYADNILKGFASAISIVLCGILSTLLFEFVPSLMFVFGSFVVISATVLYSQPDRKDGGEGGICPALGI